MENQMDPQKPFQSIPVTAEHEGERLDAFVAEVLPALSRRAVREAIRCGQVMVNGRRLGKGYRLRAGNVVEVAMELSAAEKLQPNPELPVSILYNDEHLVVVNKPAGLPSHALRPYERNTVANFLLAHFPEMAALSHAGLEAGLVHRLDTDTSGALLAARTAEARAAMRAQFAAHAVRKEYVALVAGSVCEPGTVQFPLTHDPHTPRKVRIAQGEEGREATTYFWPLERYQEYTLLRVEIRTGVLHQIRAHLAAIGHPIIGDRLYGSVHADLARQFLHATRLVFQHPMTGRQCQVGAPLPEDLEDVLRRLRRHERELYRASRPRRRQLTRRR